MYSTIETEENFNKLTNTQYQYQLPDALIIGMAAIFQDISISRIIYHLFILYRVEYISIKWRHIVKMMRNQSVSVANSIHYFKVVRFIVAFV